MLAAHSGPLLYFNGGAVLNMRVCVKQRWRAMDFSKIPVKPKGKPSSYSVQAGCRKYVPLEERRWTNGGMEHHVSALPPSASVTPSPSSQLTAAVCESAGRRVMTSKLVVVDLGATRGSQTPSALQAQRMRTKKICNTEESVRCRR